MPFRNHRTEEILNSIAEGLFTVDKNFKIIFFNQAAERITGYHHKEVIGRFCKHVFRSSLCFEGCPIAQVLEKKQNVFDVEARIQKKGGKQIPIKMNAAVLENGDGEPTGGVISFRDLSEMETLCLELDKDSEFFGIVGRSKPMKEIFELIREISDTDATVLIQGESGTGKELIANAIQATSMRADKPFIKVNCSVFPAQLLASELFGHVKGAFTGAIKDRVGRFEAADGGTLFLDEIAEMPLEMQIQLLRVLQEGTFERIGESKTRHVDVRVIAATNTDIQQAISQGKFREDLYYRLNVIPITVPPLRERMDDIAALVRYFIKKYSIIYKKTIRDIDENAMGLLLHYNWPGNIRELENAIAYAFARTKGDTIMAEKLPPSIRENGSDMDLKPKRRKAFQQEEYEKLVALLEKHKWNRSKVAKELGIGRTTLWRKLRMYGIME